MQRESKFQLKSRVKEERVEGEIMISKHDERMNDLQTI